MFDLATIMATELVTVHPSTSLYRARTLMNEKGIRHLPVVDDDGALVGLLTQSDVLGASDSFLKDRDDQLEVAHFPVEDAMVTEVETVPSHADLRQAALFLERHKIGCLPVVDDGQLVGIVTDTDFVGVAINLLEQLEAFEPESDD
ncbi:MAG: CBS domain-containing protein [Pseudomonadota bacterium]